MNILAAILLFGVIVLVHEFGHFLLAKLNGIGVVEFSIGMGPRLFSFERGETRYSIKALPFGGSCMMIGEDQENPDPKAFNGKPVWSRILVIAAGPVFNFILAFLFAMVIVAQIGHDAPILYGVSDGSPAQEAGLQAGDKLTRINNRRITAYRDVMLYTFTHPGDEITIRYERPPGGEWVAGGAAEKRSATLMPAFDETRQAYLLGVQFRGYEKIKGLGELIHYSAYEVKYCVVSTLDSIGMMVRKKIKVDDAVTGPVGIVSMVGETVQEGREAGPRAMLLVISNWILLLSSSLGIMNLLPIPALDGGRLLFLLIELVRGKPVDPEKEGMVHMAGMILLMTLMVFVLFNDIRKLM
ncbi:MAG: site-2 protease family protein [Lachnospiraceae bacterium]|nr:site-2 protease family protein [Lachnospiraceae bacterium]